MALCALMCGCSVYRNYERPDNLPVDSLYRNDGATQFASDTASLGNLPWKEVFRDTVLQGLIEYGLTNNTDMQIALLRLEQAQAKLSSAKLAYLPSFSIAAQGSISKSDGAASLKSYQIPLQAEWEIDCLVNCATLRKRLKRQCLNNRLIAELFSLN